MGDFSLPENSSAAAAAPTPGYPATPPAFIGIGVSYCKNPARPRIYEKIDPHQI